MKDYCKKCKKFFSCDTPDFRPECGCRYFESVKKHDFVLIHKRLDTGLYSFVAFGDSFIDLILLRNSLPDYGKKLHDFYVVSNRSDSRVTSVVNDIKDGCLLNICENVAYTLSRAEYSMLKKKYSRSKFCFDCVKFMIADACNILENY